MTNHSPSSLDPVRRAELIERGRRHAEEDAAREVILASRENRISLVPGNCFSLDGYFCKPELAVILLSRAIERSYYESEDTYDKPPACFALATGNGLGMTPHKRSREPQAVSCDTCQWNRYGTAQNGKGKRCREYRRLAVLAQGADDLIAILRVPPTSIRPFRNFLHRVLMKRGVQMHEAYTRLSFKPGSKFPVLIFKFMGVLPESVLKKVRQHLKSAIDIATAPY
ncbi:MAG: hypothetical protein ACLQU2_16810 [Candidatus Binataceae bacterium]